MRLRREGLHQLPRPHQRPQAPEEPRHVHEGREVIARPGRSLVSSVTAPFGYSVKRL